MRIVSILTIVPGALAVAFADVAHKRAAECNADNCLRAVRASAFPTNQGTLDCAASLVFTVTPSTVTSSTTTTISSTLYGIQTTTTTASVVSTITSTVTTSTTFYNTVSSTIGADGGAKRRAVVTTSAIPKYASVCSSFARWSSACSCIGQAGTTKTLSTPTTTITIKATNLITSTTATETVTSTTTISTSTLTETSTLTVQSDVPAFLTFSLRVEFVSSQHPSEQMYVSARGKLNYAESQRVGKSASELRSFLFLSPSLSSATVFSTNPQYDLHAVDCIKGDCQADPRASSNFIGMDVNNINDDPAPLWILTKNAPRRCFVDLVTLEFTCIKKYQDTSSGITGNFITCDGDIYIVGPGKTASDADSTMCVGQKYDIKLFAIAPGQ